MEQHSQNLLTDKMLATIGLMTAEASQFADRNSMLQYVANTVAAGFDAIDGVFVSIVYKGISYTNGLAADAAERISVPIVIVGEVKGSINVSWPTARNVSDAADNQYIECVADIIATQVMRLKYADIKVQNRERIKELDAINYTTQIVKHGLPIDETLQSICNMLPRAWLHNDWAAARIKFQDKQYTSLNFMVTQWGMNEQFATIDNKKGSIEIYYLRDFEQSGEPVFLPEERNLLANIARLITGYLNSFKGSEIILQKAVIDVQQHRTDQLRRSLSKEHKPLQQYFNQQMMDKYVYLDMMKYKIKHILFVSTLYDAFLLENDDTFFEKFMGEIYQYSLFSLPRITGVSSEEDALEILETTPIDLVILMVGIDRESPIALSAKIKEMNDSIPVYLLINKKDDEKYFNNLIPTITSVDKMFVWTGDTSIIFAIVKSIEDSVNVANDTKVGLVRVILLIEDSPSYYSRYLQILYSIVFDQVQKLLPEVEKNELNKITKIRSRPKILHARNYEEAIAIFNKYKDFLLCVISDVEFDWGGKPDKQAGLKFVKYMREQVFSVPVILQSTEDVQLENASENKIFFINKNSATLFDDLRRHLIKYLGYGDFLFRTKDGKDIGVAHSLREFEMLIHDVPQDSFVRHAIKNQYSIWLMARGEIQLARTINAMRLEDRNDIEQSRQDVLNAIRVYREQKKKGKVLSYDETSTVDEHNIVRFAGGTMGGKGRGLAFIDVLIYNLDLGDLAKRINLLTPTTVIIGTDEFDTFMERNKLYVKVIDPEVSYQRLRELFYYSNLSLELERRVRDFVNHIDKPLVVRSSSTSEDSINQPFAGVFDTYIVPNGENKEKTFQLVCDAIKLVYASVYSDQARGYFNAINHKIEGEKMAVIIQELVGTQFGNYYYPHISGVAQSYNFYPIADMKPEEGYAVIAMGLGSYVVDGWKAYRFSPRYPKVSMYTTQSLLQTTQTQFYALDLTNTDPDFLADGELAAVKMVDIYDAEEHGTLKHLASVYNADNDTVRPGTDGYGPRVLNFADILQYNYFPLAETIDTILATVRDAFGSPVEIEYAVNLTPGLDGKPSFYLLQIKPLVGANTIETDCNIFEQKERLWLYTQQSLGNGTLNDIEDVIYIDNEKFNKLETIEMAEEINRLNTMMIEEGRKYILIGPGRWGSSDRFLGVPVDWSQISNARVIVEIGLNDYPLDFSLGSHFFHNVTSMNIGYFAVQNHSTKSFIRWEVLDNQETIHATKHFRHIRFNHPVTVVMDGKEKVAGICVD